MIILPRLSQLRRITSQTGHAGPARFVLVWALFIATLLTGCNTVTSSDPDPEDDSATTARLVFVHNNSVKLAELENTPPTAVSGSIRSLYSFSSGWTRQMVSVSPNGSHAVLTKFNMQGNQPRTWMGHMVILDLDSRTVRKSFNKASFVALVNYPVDAAMLVFGHDWMSDNEVLLSIQPQASTESTPFNMALVLDAAAGDVINTQYYERTAPSPITAPTHASHTRYDHTHNGGVISVAGTPVSGLPSPVYSYGIYFPEP